MSAAVFPLDVVLEIDTTVYRRWHNNPEVWWSKGHHNEAEFAHAVAAEAELDRHIDALWDVHHEWWRPLNYDGKEPYVLCGPSDPGAFPVTVYDKEEG